MRGTRYHGNVQPLLSSNCVSRGVSNKYFSAMGEIKSGRPARVYPQWGSAKANRAAGDAIPAKRISLKPRTRGMHMYHPHVHTRVALFSLTLLNFSFARVFYSSGGTAGVFAGKNARSPNPLRGVSRTNCRTDADFKRRAHSKISRQSTSLEPRLVVFRVQRVAKRFRHNEDGGSLNSQS